MHNEFWPQSSHFVLLSQLKYWTLLKLIEKHRYERFPQKTMAKICIILKQIAFMNQSSWRLRCNTHTDIGTKLLTPLLRWYVNKFLRSCLVFDLRSRYLKCKEGLNRIDCKPIRSRLWGYSLETMHGYDRIRWKILENSSIIPRWYHNRN